MISEEQKRAAREWFDIRVEFAIKHPQQSAHVETIRALLSPAPLHDDHEDAELKDAVKKLMNAGRFQQIGTFQTSIYKLITFALSHISATSKCDCEGLQERYLVICCDPKGDYYGLFSTGEKAAEWAAKQEASCVITPYIVDEPDYGNVKGN